MDLLNENQYGQKEKMPNGKKAILILLVLSIIAVMIVIVLMLYVDSKKVEKAELYINDSAVEITENLVLTDDTGNQYISLKELSELVGYEYYSNEYPKEWEDPEKCYIKNEKLITSFAMDANQIFKYEEDTKLDYQYYNLKFNILMFNKKLYIALADLQVALNMQCTRDENNNIRINTTENLIAKYEEELKNRDYTLAEDQNNRKAIAYGNLIVNKNGLWSVLNTNFEEIIGSKYSTIYFDEKNLNYIVSNSNDRYGIISNSGAVKISLKYDMLEILNYDKMLYKVKNNDKYGIMKSDETMLTQIEYDEIGYPAEPSKKIKYTLIIPELDGRTGETIVVKQNNKYGLVYLETGEEFIHCNEIDKLYAIEEIEGFQYKIEINKEVYDLAEYIQYINTTVMPIS